MVLVELVEMVLVLVELIEMVLVLELVEMVLEVVVLVLELTVGVDSNWVVISNSGLSSDYKR